MPELPEVERARKLIQDSCVGYKIKSVDAKEDKIVYTGGTTHESFVKEVEGRTITGCERKGKTFWMTLSGEGKMPVMHFGMTGMVQLKGQEPTWYRRRPKERGKVWPPKFYKFVMELEPQPDSVSQEPRELAFIDARRLARLRLIDDPVITHPPVSLLGFDPVLNHPTFEEFQGLIEKKKGTVKGMIMDQGFSAGVGNWVADEILYQARIHPACPVPNLSEQNIKDLHFQIRNIPLTAVGVNADSKHFPEDWLFRWRWGKGKKHTTQAKKAKELQEQLAEEGGSDEEDVKPKGKKFLDLPDGRPATIEFIEVSGRTTAVVKEVQKMPEGVEIKPKVTKGGKGSRSKKEKGNDDESEGGMSSTPLSAVDDDVKKEEVTTSAKATTPRQKAAAARKLEAEPDASAAKDETKGCRSAKRKQNGDADLEVEAVTPSKKPRKSAASTTPASKRKAKSSTSTGRRGAGKRNGVGRASPMGSSDLSDAPE